MTRGILAVFVAAVALASALWLHNYTETTPAATDTKDSFGSAVRKPFTDLAAQEDHPSWADPTAIFIAVVGIGVAGVLIIRREPA